MNFGQNDGWHLSESGDDCDGYGGYGYGYGDCAVLMFCCAMAIYLLRTHLCNLVLLMMSSCHLTAMMCLGFLVRISHFSHCCVDCLFEISVINDVVVVVAVDVVDDFDAANGCLNYYRQPEISSSSSLFKIESDIF